MHFHPGIDIGKGADSARNGAGGDLRAGGFQPGAVAGEFGIVAGQLDPEGRRLGVDTVAAADTDGVFVFQCALFERREQGIDIGDQDVGSLRHLDGEAGIQHIGRGHSLMHESRLLAHMLGQIGEEGDHVVPGFALDLVDPRDFPFSTLPHRLCGVLGDYAKLGLRIAGVGLDLEPDTEFVFGFPDIDHIGSGIARDHREKALLPA